MKKELFIEKYKEASEVVNKKELVDILNESIDASLKKEPHNPRGHRNLIIAMEELSELQKEVSKELRGKGDSVAILEEIADVYIVLTYIKEICGFKDEAINKAINVKKDRLTDVLKKDGYYQ